MSDLEKLRKSFAWICDSERELLFNQVGRGFGAEPEKEIEAIRALKRIDADVTVERLDLAPGDRVADIGAGCGWSSGALAPRVERLYCLDISPSAVAYAKRELASFANVEVSEMRFGDLSFLPGKINKALATGLFTQFNLYDVSIYLSEVARVLPPGGWFYFNFQDEERWNPATHPGFLRHRSRYREDPLHIFRSLHWHSKETIEKCLRFAGLEVVRSGEDGPFGTWFVVTPAENR